MCNTEKARCVKFFPEFSSLFWSLLDRARPTESELSGLMANLDAHSSLQKRKLSFRHKIPRLICKKKSFGGVLVFAWVVYRHYWFVSQRKFFNLRVNKGGLWTKGWILCHGGLEGERGRKETVTQTKLSDFPPRLHNLLLFSSFTESKSHIYTALFLRGKQ